MNMPIWLFGALLLSSSAVQADEISNLKNMLSVQAGTIKNLSEQLKSQSEQPRYLGSTPLPVTYSGTTGTAWESGQQGAAFGVTDVYSEFPGQKQYRFCMSYTDACTPDHGGLNVRIARMQGWNNITTTYQDFGDFGTTWSDSRLFRHICSSWRPVNDLYSICDHGWNATCQLQIKRAKAACPTVISRAELEFRAVGK